MMMGFTGKVRVGAKTYTETIRRYSRFFNVFAIKRFDSCLKNTKITYLNVSSYLVTLKLILLTQYTIYYKNI